jgi:formate C-acetyltransferase
MYEFREVTPRIQRYHEATRKRVLELETERAMIVTETYKKYKHYPPILRKPLLTKAICEQMTVRVEDTELFVGQVGKYGFNEETGVSSSCVMPDMDGSKWVFGAFDQGKLIDDGTGLLWYEGNNWEKVCIRKEEMEKLQTIRDFWDEYMFGSNYNAWQPEGYVDFTEMGASEYYPGADFVSRASGHLTPGHQNIIKRGYGAIRKKAQDFLDTHQGNLMGDDISKYMFYQSIVIICDGLITLHKRYAEACYAKAAEVTDEARKSELKMMGDGLMNISENPANTFWEALQAVLIYIMVIKLDSNMPGIALGRADQYSWPLLEKDIEAGRMTLDQAQELVDYFIMKSSNLFVARHPMIADGVGAGNTFQHVTLGGVIPETGEDATNPVTYMFLETMARNYLHDPHTSLRVHKNTPQKLWDCAIAVTERVGGLPLLQNDEIIIPGLIKRLGFSLADARDYSLIGCQEQVGSGTDYPQGSGVNCGGAVLYSAILVTTLNNGTNPMNGRFSGVETGYLYDMETMDDVRAAVRKQLDYFLKWQTSLNNYAQWVGRWECYHAVLSVSIDDCMENGVDCHQGGARYNSFGSTAVGLSTVGDSLTAIKYMCFDKKLCTTRELYNAIMADWKGYEDLRQQVLNEVPHYGNDDPYADEEMAWIVNTYIEICDEISILVTDKYKPGMYGAGVHVVHGKLTWATPDGRNAGQPLADAASPGQGRDVNGPLGVMNSATCFDQGCIQNGLALNVRFHPTALQGDGRDKLAMMTQAYFDNGGAEIQYNIVGSEVMRAAQEKPEDYQDLIVRIAGYSAYFTELPRPMQDDLISRNEHMAI